MTFPTFRTALGSLSFKLGAAFILVVLMAVGGMGAYAYFWARRSALQQELSNLQLLSKELATRIDLSLATGRDLADHLAHTRDVQDYFLQVGPHNQAQGVLLEWLDHQQGRTHGLSAIFVMSPEGRCLASSNRTFIGRDFSFRTYFQEAMAGHLASSDWSIGSVTKTPRIFSAAPVTLRGRIVGVLVTEFLVDQVEEAIRAIGGQGRTAAVINGQGIALSHSIPTLQYHALMPLAPGVEAELKRNRQFLDRVIPVDPISPEFAAAFKRARDTAQPQTLEYRLGNTVKRGVLSPLVERPWVVAVAIPEADILLPIHEAFKRTLGVGLAIALGVFILALGLGRSLLRPIHQLVAAMGRFGAGEVAARAPVLVQDERGQLAQAFNLMANALQVHQEHLEELVKARTLDLETTLAEVKTLRGLLPICGYCKKIRDEEGAWWQMEHYIHDHSEAEFSHGICPECRKREFPELSGPAKKA